MLNYIHRQFLKCCTDIVVICSKVILFFVSEGYLLRLLSPPPLFTDKPFFAGKTGAFVHSFVTSFTSSRNNFLPFLQCKEERRPEYKTEQK